MPDRLEEWIFTSETEPTVQHNRYLIPIDEVTMHQMLVQTNHVSRLRISVRAQTDILEINNRRRIKRWHNKELQIVWK